MKVKSKKCRHCGNTFTLTYSTTQVTCSVNCSIAYSKSKETKKQAKQWANEKKERKTALMSHSEWLKLLQVVFNTFIRERDKNKPCISCGCKVKKGHASHFFSVGSHPNLRFNEDNVHLSCIECNLYLHGNLVEYTLRLPDRIGKEKFYNLLKLKNIDLKLSIPEIQEKIKEYKNKIKQLKNENT